jgi:hypothetical protein
LQSVQLNRALRGKKLDLIGLVLIRARRPVIEPATPMRDRFTCFWFWAAFICAVIVGCQSADEAETVIDPVATAPTETSADKGNPDAPDEPAAGDAKTPSNPEVAVQFSPPFPERLELFEPPKRAQSTVRRDDESGDTVELKGFINVDGQRVVLSIDGVISPIAEGGEKYGVHVISIQPPNVVLQRGRSRWTATLE